MVNNMKITNNMIDSDLRLCGKMIRAINPLGSYGMQGIMGRISKNRARRIATQKYELHKN